MILNGKYGFFGYFVFFNYALITLGLGLFLFTTFLTVKNASQSLLYLQYTNFNFLEQLKYIELDFLSVSRTSILGLLAGFFTISVLIIGLYLTKTEWRKKKIGVVGYPALFFFYQLFWLVSFASILLGKKAKWR